MRWCLILFGLFSTVAVGSAQANIIEAYKVLKNNKPPPFDFNPASAPSVPDYRQDSAWAARPEFLDQSDVTPRGVDAIDASHAPADVFFIYPTVFFGKENWNANIDEPVYRNQVQELPLRAQASIFNGCCAVYAPHYRQMTLGGFVKWSSNSDASMDLAYQDVSRAFDYFLSRLSKGRPFIIAGHSQGSRIARRLIDEKIDGKPLARRMVAAYLLGHWMEQEWFDRNKTVKACQSRADTGCVVTYSTYAEGRNGTAQRLLLGRSSKYKPETMRRRYVCINPVSWSQDTAKVDRQYHLGGWSALTGTNSPAIDPQMVTTRCKDGALYISKPPKAYEEKAIPFGNYHNVDYNIAYMNIRENAIERVKAFGSSPL